MRILTFTSLYPSAARPRHGAFVEARIAAMLSAGGVEFRVVAPVPWFPTADPRFGEYGRYAATPRREVRLGVEIHHPRYANVPGVGMYSQPFMMAAAAFPAISRMLRHGFDFDVIDAHYFYPDGVAAAMLARQLRKPLAITARGSDVNLLPRFAWPRRLMRSAARTAGAIIVVSAALANALRAMGVDPDRISIVRNGIDTTRFAPVDRAEARRRLGLPHGTLIASVGNLIREKGHEVIIDSLVHLPHARLLIVGEGPQRHELARRVEARGLTSRVTLLAAMPQDDLKWVYGAADVVALASMREGLPNVLLEALACGTRVVATRVGGVPELVTDGVAGRVVDERSDIAFARALAEVLATSVPASRTRASVERFDWNVTARGHLAALERAIEHERCRAKRSPVAARRDA